MSIKRIVFVWLGWIVLGIVGTAVVVFCLWQFALAQYGRGWSHEPEAAHWILGHRARTLLAQSLATAEDKVVVDAAVHMLSRGQLSGPDFVNQSHTAPADSVFHQPLEWWRARMTAAAAGAAPGPDFDAEYASGLLRQIRALPGNYRAHILARAAPTGQTPRTASAPVVTNRYVVWLASQAPDHIVPVISIVPTAPEASKRLKHWLEQGVEYMRWLPIRQQIDLNGQPARSFYKLLARKGVRLMLPVGAIHGLHGNPRWVAPDAIEPAIAAGVEVDLTLAGTRGPEGQKLMPALFHLLATTDHAERITITLAGVLSGDRAEKVLEPLLAHPQYFDHLQYASGYPHPALANAIDLQDLVAEGFIDRALVYPLKTIHDVNPLAFRLAVMRNMHLPHTRLGLPDGVFVHKVE